MIKIQPINFVPEQVRNENQFNKFSQVLVKWLQRICLGLIVLIIAEISLLYVYGTVAVPLPLLAEYGTAKKEMEVIKKELTVIAKANNEEQKPLEAMAGLLAAKPDTIKFSRLEIGKNDAAKTNEWIKLEAVSENPVAFNEYILQLGQNQLFSGVVMNRIVTQKDDTMKTATIIIGRR